MSERSSVSRLPVSPVSARRPPTKCRHSSSGEHPVYRPDRLSIHEGSIADAASRNRAPTPQKETFRSREYDSANFKCATELRRLREAAGLTQEEAAELCGADPKTVRQRENGAVDLGPLKQRLRLVEAARQRYLDEEAKGHKP